MQKVKGSGTCFVLLAPSISVSALLPWYKSYKTDARFIVYGLNVIAGKKTRLFSLSHLGFTGNVTYRPDCRLMFQFTSLLIAISCQIANQIFLTMLKKPTSSLRLSPSAL